MTLPIANMYRSYRSGGSRSTAGRLQLATVKTVISYDFILKADHFKEYLLKKSISDPYNFQHLTHTGAHQAKALRCADQNELVSEFSAIRASQAPRAGLKGIKAESLHHPSRSVGAGSSMVSYYSPSMSSVSPTMSKSGWSEANSGSIRHSRSVDSFTRVCSRSFSSPTPPLSPPGRRSSRMAMKLPPNHAPSREASPTTPDFGANGDVEWSPSYCNANSRQRSTSITEGAGFHFNIASIAQAVTTPDDSAYILGSNLRPSPSATLADVPEEDEAFPWTRNSKPNLQPPPEPNAIRHSKSFPNVELSGKPSRSSSNRTRQKLQSVLSEAWGTASDPTLPHSGGQTEEIPDQSQLSRRMSSNSKTLGDSWEADIDFCYEHAAEADSAFDWYNVSKDTEKEPTTATKPATIDRSSSVYDEPISASSRATHETDAFCGPASRPSSYLATYLNLSRLTTSTLSSNTDSAMSSAVTVPGIVTPAEPNYSSQSINVAPSSGTTMGPLSPSFLVPQDWASRVTHEDTFHHKLTDSDAPKHSFQAYGPFLDDTSRDYSPRNSGSPLSKCNSQESTLPSRTASINTGHGTNSSVGSLPELVHGNAGSERVALPAESLADQIASLNVAENPTELRSMIEAARQTFIRKAEDSADEREQRAQVNLPLVYPRQRSSSESANRLLFAAEPTRPKLTTVNSVDRMRSPYVSNQPVGRSRLARASFSLFPVYNVDA